MRLWEPGFFGYTSLLFSGSLLVVIMFAIKVTALKALRKRSFETFYWVHSIGSVLFFVLLLLHGSHLGVLKTWMYVIGPIIVYIIDRTFRLLREKGSRLQVRREKAVLKGSDMVCLRIPRTFTYLAGQYCDIKVPLVSNLEWHPFTIASSPHESEMLFYIKVNGDWTRNLYALFKERSGDHDGIMVHVRGPYGAPAQHVGQYEHVVLISGGVGATPFCAITKYAHHWILNYTKRGAEASNTVSAAFTRNQSVTGTPSMPGTPSQHASGYSSAAQRSSNPSRHLSRNQSGTNFARNLSRNISRSRSKNGSRPMSRSGSGRLDRFGSRSGSGRNISRSGSGQLERFNSGHFDRVGSAKTNDSIGIIIQDQRAHHPHGPAYLNEDLASPYRPEGVQLAIPGSGRRGDDAAMQDYLDTVSEVLPEDYDEALGNPDAPIPDRRAAAPDAAGPAREKQQMFEIVKEYDSSQALFDDDEEEEAAVRASRQGGHEYIGTGVLDEGGFGLDPIDLEAGGLELEDQILREQQTASNAYNMLGMSFGPLAMLRHMHAQDAKKMRSSMVRASMNLMDDAIDAAVWQDRLLFYLHSVTLNWVLLWIMLIRFSLVAMGNITKQFYVDQLGLGIFASDALNIVDLILGIFITIPVVGAVIMEIYMHGTTEFLADNVGNCFDLFVLVPLLLGCIMLHILNLADVGIVVFHMSKFTVFIIWPVLSLTLLWRIGRTIGSRVVLAQYFKSTHAQTKSLDYIWVSKTHEDDSWLIEELLPLAESNIVRLHRFITRHGPKTEPWMLDYEKVPLKTTYSRPDWDDVFGSLVERSKSGSVIGVFFCGPDSMARMVQQAAMNAMTKSLNNAYQRGYMQKRGAHYAREEDLGFAQSGAAGNGVLSKMTSRAGAVTRGLSGGRNPSSPLPDDTRDPSAYGCSVRISVRVENFT